MTETTEVVVAETEKPTFVPPAAIEPIRTPAQYEQAVELLRGVKAYQERVVSFFAPHKKRAYETWKGLCADEKKALEAAEPSESAIKAAMVAYDDEQQRLREAEERRLADEARKAEERRRLDEAAALEAEASRTGNADLALQAQQLIEEPVETPVVQVASYTPRVGGVAFRETWSAKVVDMKKLVKWVARNISHVYLLKPDDAALNSMARAQREHLKIDGVQAVKTKGVAAGRK